jgi:hypothetical protein
LTPATCWGHYLPVVLIALLLARQHVCEELNPNGPESWPSLFGRSLQQGEDYGVENDDVDIQQRDRNAVCSVRARPGQTAACNSNCAVCVFNPNVQRDFRTCRCCRPGFYSTSYTTPGTLCTPCPPGRFQPNSGASSCR